MTGETATSPAGGESADDGYTRPSGCECWDVDAGLCCFACWVAGFETQNPDAPAAREGDS